MSNLKLIGEGMAVLGLVFEKEITPPLIDAYAASLADMDEAELERGIQAAMRRCRFFPRPVEIRDYGIRPDERIERAIAEERRELEAKKKLEGPK